jgi:hypothetical protein
MANVPSISEVSDEILQSILATAKKQRRIRSGTFWKKFRFERRTRERIESIKIAFKDRAIAFNLEDSRFGSERRSELIILSYVEENFPQSTTKIKLKAEILPPVKHKKIGEPALEMVHKYDQIQARLNRLAKVEQLNFDVTLIFSVLFVEMFWNETPNYELKSGVFGATRSNWTYHTAIAIAQTCKIMNLTCKFEALGKRDAVIETKGEASEIILVAEWEWDYDDIFGAGKELDKLKASCKKHETANAFLLIYCPNSKYLSHLERIAEEWIGDTTMAELAPTLFLHTIIFEQRGSIREFKRLKTVMIHSSGIDVWSDNYL